jgi:hypothetical protein
MHHWNGGGGSLERLCRAESRQQRGLDCKQNETEPFIYGNDQTTPNSLGASRAPTTPQELRYMRNIYITILQVFNLLN